MTTIEDGAAYRMRDDLRRALGDKFRVTVKRNETFPGALEVTVALELWTWQIIDDATLHNAFDLTDIADAIARQARHKMREAVETAGLPPKPGVAEIKVEDWSLIRRFIAVNDIRGEMVTLMQQAAA